MENLSEKVINIIALNRGKNAADLNENTDLINDLALDSLDKVELIMEFENTFFTSSNFIIWLLNLIIS